MTSFHNVCFQYTRNRKYFFNTFCRTNNKLKSKKTAIKRV